MKIRLLTIDDYDNCNCLWKSIDGIGLRTLDDSREGIDRFLKRNPYTNFVCSENSTIIGTILCGNDGRRGYIYHTAVDTKYRSKGIGKLLVNAVLKALKAEKINKVALVVFKDNPIGNGFWEKLEFEIRDDLNYRNKSIK